MSNFNEDISGDEEEVVLLDEDIKIDIPNEGLKYLIFRDCWICTFSRF